MQAVCEVQVHRYRIVALWCRGAWCLRACSSVTGAQGDLASSSLMPPAACIASLTATDACIAAHLSPAAVGCRAGLHL